MAHSKPRSRYVRASEFSQRLVIRYRVPDVPDSTKALAEYRVPVIQVLSPQAADRVSERHASSTFISALKSIDLALLTDFLSSVCLSKTLPSLPPPACQNNLCVSTLSNLGLSN